MATQKPNFTTKHESNFILKDRCNVCDVEVLGNIKSSDRKLLKCMPELDLKRGRITMTESRKADLLSVRARVRQLKITLEGKFVLLTGYNEDSGDKLNENLTR